MLSRDEVFAIVAQENDHAERWDNERPEGSLADADKPVEVWLLWMEEYLALARKATVTGYDKTAALHHLRAVLNLGVTCAMHHGLPAREDTDDVFRG